MPITTVTKITGPVTVLISWMKASASHFVFSAGPGATSPTTMPSGDRDDHPEPQLLIEASLLHGQLGTRSLNFQRVPADAMGDEPRYDFHPRRALPARHPLGLRRARVRGAAQAPRHARRHPVRPPQGRAGRQGRDGPQRRHHQPALQPGRGDLLRSPPLGDDPRRRGQAQPRDRARRRVRRPRGLRVLRRCRDVRRHRGADGGRRQGRRRPVQPRRDPAARPAGCCSTS